MKSVLNVVVFLCLSCNVFGDAFADEPPENVVDEISFANDVRPLLAANCFGCHQGAINRGGYVMTEFDSMIVGGESGDAAIVSGAPDESRLIELITSHDGDAEMPPNAEPLTQKQVDLIREWVFAGAKNDFAKSTEAFSLDTPPKYSRLPVVKSIEFSPDGKLMAVTGFHEVLILETPSEPELNGGVSPLAGNLIQRLIGLSSSIEALKFSPDGTRLAVSGGSPGEFGEIQVWDVAAGKLQLSKTLSFDTIYGVNWSPDGKLISFGCTDTTLRAIDSDTGEQVLFQGAHEDWVRDTVFSVDGSRLVSVGRDMSCKLTEVPTQRFVDNITSITPGVLKGGIASVDRHPSRDEIVIGGADGVPKVYRMDRITIRKIGDDANLIRQMPKMPGRVNSVAVSEDGNRIAAGSSLDGAGFLQVYSYEFDTAMPDNIKAIVTKVASSQSAEEKKALADYVIKDVKTIFDVGLPGNSIYAVDFHPNGKMVACGGSDGLIRLMETETGKLLASVAPINIEPTASNSHVANWNFENEKSAKEPLSIPTHSKLIALKVSPESIHYTQPTDYTQIVVQAAYEDGSTLDVTRNSDFKAGEPLLMDVGFVQAAKSGATNVEIEFGGLKHSIAANVELGEKTFVPDFIHDVNPVLSKLGCNAGTCHGSQGGKQGFKLSLRGYDPIYDIRSFTDDMASRRTNLASPETSLMLMKPAGEVPHEGGKLFDRNDKHYWLIHDWIRGGAKLNHSQPKVASLKLLPENPVLANESFQQQMRVVATYTDGSSLDVTREAVIEIGDMEIGKVSGSIVTALRRGESALLARYEGAFTATTMTVMGNRETFVWSPPETWGTIDELVAAKWERMKIKPSELCSDAEFLRRAYLDLTGLPPTPDQTDAFLEDSTPTKEKRDALVDQLVGNDEFVEHWANKWSDLMQVNRKYLGPEGAVGLRDWIRGQVKSNRPYNEFAFEILTASGSNRENPAASYYKIHRTPEEAMENTTHLFLATRFNCNKCHDHPFERWTQDQYYETAAFFAQVDRTKDPESGDKRIGGSAVEDAKPLYEIIEDITEGEVTHERTGDVAKPQFPFECNFETPATDSRRNRLASWITSPDNPYFATSYVNRLWGYMNGVGLIEPLDDIRAGNPPSNPQLVEFLRKEFVENGFDSRHIIKLICKSRTYQLSVATNEFNADDTLNYSHAKARRLPAEVIFDSVHAVTGSELKIPGVKPGTRAAALPDSGAKLPSGFLSTLGRPARESACECERANGLQLGSVLALVSGPDVAKAIGDPNSEIAKIVATEPDDRKVVDSLFLRILNRHATDAEIDVTLDSFQEISNDHLTLVEQRDERAKLVENELPEIQRIRDTAIAEASEELQTAITEVDPKLTEREATRESAIISADKALSEYSAVNQASFERYKRRQLFELQWHPIQVTEFTSKAQTPFQIQSDRSILLEPKEGKDLYTVITQTDLSGVSAVRLEALSHESLPGNGPGLAPNGNIVLTEFEIEIAHPDRPDQWQKVPIVSAMANITQGGFDVAKTFDGKKGDKGGWALVNALGKNSWATYQVQLPFGHSNGTLIRFKLHHNFDDKHKLGRFRISLSKFHEPVGLGLSEDLLAELSKPEMEWKPEYTANLTALFGRDDVTLLKLKSAVADASKPLEIDERIVKLREKFARVSQPVPPDPTLTQLEKDVAISAIQLENSRLTAAQDLTWALINSPAFLFNH